MWTISRIFRWRLDRHLVEQLNSTDRRTATYTEDNDDYGSQPRRLVRQFIVVGAVVHWVTSARLWLDSYMQYGCFSHLARYARRQNQTLAPRCIRLDGAKPATCQSSDVYNTTMSSLTEHTSCSNNRSVYSPRHTMHKANSVRTVIGARRFSSAAPVIIIIIIYTFV